MFDFVFVFNNLSDIFRNCESGSLNEFVSMPNVQLAITSLMYLAAMSLHWEKKEKSTCLTIIFWNDCKIM